MRYDAQEELSQFANYVANFNGVGSFKRKVLGYLSSLLMYFYSPKKALEQVDVLAVHLTSRSNPQWRKFMESLKQRHSLVVKDHFIESWAKALRFGQYARVDYKVKSQFALKAGIARFLVERYRPRVMIVATEDTLVPFLRFECQRTGAVLVNIAHSIIHPNPSFSMCDFDYYFVYGESSWNSLRSISNRYGSTRVVLAGSLNFDSAELLPLPSEDKKQVTYFSTWLPKHQRKNFLRQFQAIKHFAVTHPEVTVVVRLHPLEATDFWGAAQANVPNIRIDNADVSMRDSLRDSRIAICSSHSTAFLDAACLGRVSIVIDVDSHEAPNEIYSTIERLRRDSSETLGEVITRVESMYMHFQRLQSDVVSRHLAIKSGSHIRMGNWLSSLCQGNEIDMSLYLDSNT